MTKYDKELQTGTDEYEEATKALDTPDLREGKPSDDVPRDGAASQEDADNAHR